MMKTENEYLDCKLVAKGHRVETTSGKFIFSVPLTELGKWLLDDQERREGESWLDYRQRTKPDRVAEERKRGEFAAALVEAWNNRKNNED